MSSAVTPVTSDARRRRARTALPARSIRRSARRTAPRAFPVFPLSHCPAARRNWAATNPSRRLNMRTTRSDSSDVSGNLACASSTRHPMPSGVPLVGQRGAASVVVVVVLPVVVEVDGAVGAVVEVVLVVGGGGVVVVVGGTGA
jgi:hypothetical protein